MDNKCKCGHSKKSHRWRPYGSHTKYLGCHIKGCKCKSYQDVFGELGGKK